MSPETVVFFPVWAMGHLIPIVDLAKLFTSANFSVAIPFIESPQASSSASDAFISAVTSAHPSISFHRLPSPSYPSSGPPRLLLHLVSLGNPQLSHFLKSLSSTSTIRALVVDMFATSALDVAEELGLPAYVFFSGGASVLSAFVSFPSIQSKLSGSLKDLGDSPLNFPGLPPVPASHLPIELHDRDSENSKLLVCNFERMPTASGIIVNSFEALEPRAVKAIIGEGLCVPMPEVYCVGPLIADSGESDRHVCLTWLDAQPERSVVFLCFGSMGAFSAEQLREIATALERSRLRFLWVVRAPPSEPSKRIGLGPRPEPDLSKLMPEGFLERSEGRGMVVKSWAPQAAVLRHGSVGGFVSHCGWNSTLESIAAGVPIIAWPMYAEQMINKVFLVEEAKVAVTMEGYDKEMVTAEEVERKVRWVMEEEGGKELRKRAKAMKEAAAAAREEGGPSHKAWIDLVRAILVSEQQYNNYKVADHDQTLQ